MTIAFDASSSAVNTPATTSLTWSHTCTGTSTTGALIVFAESSVAGAITATYNGTSMTSAISDSTWNMNYFYLLNPTVGAHNVVISGGNGGWVGIAISITGVLSFDQAQHGTKGSNSPFTCGFTPANTNSWAIDAALGNIASGTPALASSTSTNLKTQGWPSISTTELFGMGTRALTTVTSYTDSWTITGGTTSTTELFTIVMNAVPTPVVAYITQSGR